MIELYLKIYDWDFDSKMKSDVIFQLFKLPNIIINKEFLAQWESVYVSLLKVLNLCPQLSELVYTLCNTKLHRAYYKYYIFYNKLSSKTQSINPIQNDNFDKLTDEEQKVWECFKVSFFTVNILSNDLKDLPLHSYTAFPLHI